MHPSFQMKQVISISILVPPTPSPAPNVTESHSRWMKEAHATREPKFADRCSTASCDWQPPSEAESRGLYSPPLSYQILSSGKWALSLRRDRLAMPSAFTHKPPSGSRPAAFAKKTKGGAYIKASPQGGATLFSLYACCCYTTQHILAPWKQNQNWEMTFLKK